MALRNAFAKLLTESVEGAVEAVLVKMDERQNRQGLVELPRALQYARTINDALRVNVENGPQAVIYPGNSSSAIQGAVIAPTWFSNAATFMVDEREQQRLQSEINFNVVRTGRWVFS